MGFNIKNNYGPNIEVKDGGRLTLTQGKNGLWHTVDVDAEDAEDEEVTAEQMPQTAATKIKPKIAFILALFLH